jgi:hypothetical protein
LKKKLQAPSKVSPKDVGLLQYWFIIDFLQLGFCKIETKCTKLPKIVTGLSKQMKF